MSDTIKLLVNEKEVFKHICDVVVPPIPPIPPIPTLGGYTVKAGKLFTPEGIRLRIKGVSHFGFNVAKTLQPQWMWGQNWKVQLKQIQDAGFNAVRVPFIPDTLYSPASARGYVDPGINPGLTGLTPLQFLDLWMAEANRLGLYIMLDFHSVSGRSLYFHWFVGEPLHYGAGRWVETWNQQPYSEANWIRDLVFVAKRYAYLPKFFALDIFNEPHDLVTWGKPTPGKVSWKDAAEKAAAAILAANPNLLIFVQGISDNFEGPEKNIPINWGENFQPQLRAPLLIPAEKLVLSPHSYGPDVYYENEFDAVNFPDNLPENWEQLFGQFYPNHAVVVGEWGGRYGVGGVGIKDKQWQNAFVNYLISKGMTDTFYWCWTPNSDDTGGILDDNLNVRADKMELLKRLWE